MNLLICIMLDNSHHALWIIKNNRENSHGNYNECGRVKTTQSKTAGITWKNRSEHLSSLNENDIASSVRSVSRSSKL